MARNAELGTRSAERRTKTPNAERRTKNAERVAAPRQGTTAIEGYRWISTDIELTL